MARRSEHVRPDMRASLVDGSLSAVSGGLGEYLVPFAIAAGLSGGLAGLLVPVPQLLGAVIALGLPALIAHIRSIRFVTLSLAGVHAGCLGLLAVAGATAFLGLPAAWVLFGIAIVTWTVTLAAAPAWTVWAASLFPRAMRPGFLGVRTRLHHTGMTLGLVGGGLALGWSQQADRASLMMFAGLFALAALLRGVSVWFMARQSEPEPIPPGHRDPGWQAFLGQLRHERGGKTLVYMLAFGLASATAVPFFAPYMLDALNLSYTSFMILITSGFLVRSLVLPTLGVLAKRIGAPRLLVGAALGTLPLAGLWLISTNFWWLLAVHVLSGVAWAAFELSTQLLVFDTLPGDTRAATLSRYNVLFTAAQAIGALLGFVALRSFVRAEDGYRATFILSTTLRFLAVPLTFRVLGLRLLSW